MNAVSNELQNVELSPKIVESLMVKGDLSGLSPQQKIEYYHYRCKALNLDPATKPFDLLRLQGKEVLYANASCTQQLCNSRGLSVQITQREKIEGIFVVSARCTGSDGRSTDNMAALPVDSLKGDALANAMMKCATKAIRRTVLAHCGLGMMDETETETIPGARKAPISESPMPAIEQAPAPDPMEGYPIFVPGQEEAYGLYATHEAAALAIRDLANRVMDSARIKDEDKPEKVRALLAANKPFAEDLADIERALGEQS